jgi:predicted RNA-binding Zn ribbon-like protein
MRSSSVPDPILVAANLLADAGWDVVVVEANDHIGGAAEDAVRLLESPQVHRVKVCRVTCGWLVLDLTRNASRRWCAISTCGVREKIRRQSVRRALRA